MAHHLSDKFYDESKRESVRTPEEIVQTTIAPLQFARVSENFNFSTKDPSIATRPLGEKMLEMPKGLISTVFSWNIVQTMRTLFFWLLLIGMLDCKVQCNDGVL
ncbi:unnamed protein product [Brugia pahangi]|uniref:Uncharacterized protein n=1 Tax=Brugia pahangi TaxID=6280 RepID=A0A0N4T6M4_BRUPA|nr:unnamed protein product [Brugia pahangi]